MLVIRSMLFSTGSERALLVLPSAISLITGTDLHRFVCFLYGPASPMSPTAARMIRQLLLSAGLFLALLPHSSAFKAQDFKV